MDSTEIIKCVVVGDEEIGSTSMLTSMIGGSFSQEYIPTMFENYSLKYNDECTIDLWDTGGADDCDGVRELSYPQTDVVIINFSLVDPNSFNRIKTKWYPEINQHLKDVPIILVGNKLDLRKDQKMSIGTMKRSGTMKRLAQSSITYFQGLKLAKEIRAVKYLECSALANKGIQAVADEVCRSGINKT